MGENSAIQWTHHTMNPWLGCEEVSAECDNCYARNGSARLGAAHGLKLWGGDRFFTSESYWKKPMSWDKKAAAAGARHRVFCASYADVFEDREDLAEPRARLRALIERTPHLDWLLLTKRPENIRKLVPASWQYEVPPNVWLGTTCGLPKSLPRVVDLVTSAPRAPVKFVSVEPQIENLTIPSYLLGAGGVTWVINGGESGPKARPFDIAWARWLRGQCAAKGAAFFMKQLGARPYDSRSDTDFEVPDPVRIELRDSHGGDISEWPEGAPRVREFPRLQEAA